MYAVVITIETMSAGMNAGTADDKARHFRKNTGSSRFDLGRAGRDDVLSVLFQKPGPLCNQATALRPHLCSVQLAVNLDVLFQKTPEWHRLVALG